mgnify:CR=1 FL=1
MIEPGGDGLAVERAGVGDHRGAGLAGEGRLLVRRVRGGGVEVLGAGGTGEQRGEEPEQ